MTITIEGANEHNLQNIDVTLGEGLTVVTGVSGSGKTSLVFDTLYHEAQRRLLEIFSLGSSKLNLSPANVRAITGLGPAVAVGQNLLNRNPNSTLASASGLHPFLRLLYARFGQRRCAHCGAELLVLTEDEIVERLVSLATDRPRQTEAIPAEIRIMATLLHHAPGSHRTLLQILVETFGRQAIYVDGQPLSAQATAAPKAFHLEPTQPHSIEVEVARLGHDASPRQARLATQAVYALGAHAVKAVHADEQPLTLSRAPVCAACGAWFGDLEATHFRQSCPACNGQGCARCDHTGLPPEAAAVRWNGLRLPELLALPVRAALGLFSQTTHTPATLRLHREITQRLEALDTVGLGYITLDRSSPTLSRGEAQRVRLAVALTSRLEDMLHVLDEPTVGQHPADVARLLPALRQLAGPVIYVEHDRTAAAAADQAIDLGPGAGSQGGQVLFNGTPAGLWAADTTTGRYFSLRTRVMRPHTPLPAPEHFLVIRGADRHNLQQIDVALPLNRLSVVSGVSGSGKSTLVEDVLVASLAAGQPLGCQALEMPAHITALKPVLVDQSPIGRNPRSNPATYTGLADVVRDYYAAVTGLSPSHFSFNRPEGACPTCNGMGAIEVDMRYLPSAWIGCSDCNGQRFCDEALAARVKLGGQELSIADFYTLSVAEVLPLLSEAEALGEKNRRTARRMLGALNDVGLGYLPLGQPSPTLSGGEAQRVKLAKYLGQGKLSEHLLALDEPSTGLHPQDVGALLAALDRLVRDGATLVIIEHNTDIIRAADWVIDLGPGAGPAGGRVVYAGAPEGLLQTQDSLTGQALREEDDSTPANLTETQDKYKGPGPVARPACIAIRDARAHNLQGVDVDFPKGALNVVTGVSGSGKSSLVSDVLEAEARRRYLETLSLYERQSTREGPEAEVDSLSGLGVTISIGSERRLLYERRANVGTASEIAHHLALLLAWIGQRTCLDCGAAMQRTSSGQPGAQWRCPVCQATATIAEARHFSASTYAAACLTCHGVGSLQVPAPEKLIIAPEKTLCGGAMYSPGFFPKGYLCKPFNGGYDMVQALAARYQFDPASTAWNAMPPQAQHAFLYGDPQPLEVTFRNRSGQSTVRTVTFPGFYGFIRDWDVGGTYTRTQACPECKGARLRPEYLAVKLAGHDVHQLSEMPLARLADVLQTLSPGQAQSEHQPSNAPVGVPLGHASQLVSGSLKTTLRRLHFLQRVGLGYLNLNRPTNTLSAGEAQRIRLAGLLGSELTALTLLLDEPTRGLHPVEVEALLSALLELRDGGNTLIVVEHDPLIIRAADYLVDMGPGAGSAGGKIVAHGTPAQVAQADTLTGGWLRGERRPRLPYLEPPHEPATRPPSTAHPETTTPTSHSQTRRRPEHGWLLIHGARANNLRGETVRFPLGLLVGVCGVSGSGKSTLVVDTLGQALAPRKYTTSVAQEAVDAGEHDAIEGAPARTLVIDQTRAGVTSPAAFLGLEQALRSLYAGSQDAQALGLDEKALGRTCSACNGQGASRVDLGFLPPVYTACDTCRGTGYRPEAWEVHLRGLSLPELDTLTMDQVYERFGDEKSLSAALLAARQVGLGYLALRQPGHTLSGGEAQRLKIANELRRKAPPGSLYILDEPTLGQHMEDVERLNGVLNAWVEGSAGRNTVIVIEHHPHLLAACDWLIELGPGGGPEGGRIIASGPPQQLAGGDTPTAPYLRQVLQAVFSK